jgi:hypothetical protein
MYAVRLLWCVVYGTVQHGSHGFVFGRARVLCCRRSSRRKSGQKTVVRCGVVIITLMSAGRWSFRMVAWQACLQGTGTCTGEVQVLLCISQLLSDGQAVVLDWQTSEERSSLRRNGATVGGTCLFSCIHTPSSMASSWVRGGRTGGQGWVCAVLCCAVLCCAVLCCAVLCCAVLCCAVLGGNLGVSGLACAGMVLVAVVHVYTYPR